MKRDDALKLVGTRVSAWTSANGEYTGILNEVTTDRPWRGVVMIDGVQSVPNFEYGRQTRRGFRPGEVIDVGGTNIRACEKQGTSFADALRREITALESFERDEPERRLWKDSLAARRKQLEQEETTGPPPRRVFAGAAGTQEPHR